MGLRGCEGEVPPLPPGGVRVAAEGGGLTGGDEELLDGVDFDASNSFEQEDEYDGAGEGEGGGSDGADERDCD